MIGFEKRRKIAAFCFVGPWLAGFLTFTLYPLLYSLYLTFCGPSPEGRQWVGFKNYLQIFSEKQFWHSGMNTLIFGLISTPVTLCFALLLALLINQKLKGINLFRALYFLPVVAASDIVSTMVGTILFRRILVINVNLSNFGIHLSQEAVFFITLITMLMMLSLWRTGIQMLIFLMGLTNVPHEYYEAAEIDGATRWQKFWWITIPVISPLILINLLITVVESFTSLTTTMRVVFRRSPPIFIWDYINRLFYTQSEHEPALAAVWVFIIITLALIGLMFYLFNRKTTH